jgi:hypothetical protein
MCTWNLIQHCHVKGNTQQEKAYFHQQIGLKFKEESSAILHLEQLCVVLEKDGEGQLDRMCEQWRSITQSWGGREYPTYSERREANGIGHILHSDCLLKLVEEKMEGTVTQGRRRQQLLAVLKVRRGYWKLKEETVGHTVWRIFFQKGNVPVKRQTMWWWHP